MHQLLIRFRLAYTERGASLVEYALLLALIAVVMVGAVTLLGETAAGTLDRSGSSDPRRHRLSCSLRLDLAVAARSGAQSTRRSPTGCSDPSATVRSATNRVRSAGKTCSLTRTGRPSSSLVTRSTTRTG